MVGIESSTHGKVVASATLYRNSVCHSTLRSRASLCCLPPRTATTYLPPERLVPYISPISRCYSAPSYRMDASASAGHELLSFINASPTRENAPS